MQKPTSCAKNLAMLAFLRCRLFVSSSSQGGDEDEDEDEMAHAWVHI
jgi:hypothetical protein